jgi:hypothetical protein
LGKPLPITQSYITTPPTPSHKPLPPSDSLDFVCWVFFLFFGLSASTEQSFVSIWFMSCHQCLVASRYSVNICEQRKGN